MAIFVTTLGKIGHLFLLIIAGFIIMKVAKLPPKATNIVSKLVSTLLMPSLILSNFMDNFTVQRISKSWGFLVTGLIVGLVSIPLAMLVSKFTAKTPYLRKIHTYCLAFSNFGFMGTAVMTSLAPDIFLDYLILATPLWIFNYAWAVPALLIPSKSSETETDKKHIFRLELRNLANPMFIAMLIGIIIGLTAIPVPDFVRGAVTSLGNCMSPVTMLLTGMCVAKIKISKVLEHKSIYVLSFLRLIVIPLIFIGIIAIFKLDYNISLCALCALAMPLGLNSVVIPEGYGQDTSEASGMAIVSHLCSAVTIPLMMSIFEAVIK